jgi:hypothetical protein
MNRSRQVTELTDGTTLRWFRPTLNGAEVLRAVRPDGVVVALFRMQRGELRIAVPPATARWEPAARRWAGLPAELRQAVLRTMGILP